MKTKRKLKKLILEIMDLWTNFLKSYNGPEFDKKNRFWIFYKFIPVSYRFGYQSTLFITTTKNA